VAAVIRDELPEPFSKVFHHYVGHLWRNGGNFLTNSVLKCFDADVYKPCPWGIPTGKNRRGSNRASARATRYRLVRRRVDLGIFLLKFPPANDELFGLWPSPAGTKSPLNHQIPSIWAGRSSVTFHNTDQRLQSRSHHLPRNSKVPLHLNGTQHTRQWLEGCAEVFVEGHGGYCLPNTENFACSRPKRIRNALCVAVTESLFLTFRHLMSSIVDVPHR